MFSFCVVLFRNEQWQRKNGIRTTGCVECIFILFFIIIILYSLMSNDAVGMAL